MSRLREDMAKIKKVLMEKGEAPWREIMEATKIPSGTLSKRMNLLLSRHDLETRQKPENRRITLYSLVDKAKAEGEVLKYECVKFIESMKDPEYGHGEKEGTGYSIFISWPSSKERDPEAARRFTEVMETIAAPFLSERMKVLPPGTKLAWVITYE